jgi:PEP-CTERM motif
MKTRLIPPRDARLGHDSSQTPRKRQGTGLGIAILLAGYAFAAPQVNAGSLTYTVISYTTTGSVTGTITTDGRLGLLEVSDIVAQITINVPGASPSTETINAPTIILDGPLYATTSALTIPTSDAPAGTALEFLGAGASLSWIVPSTGSSFITQSANIGTPSITGTFTATDPIAQVVPEPSTLLLSGIAGVVGLGAWVRRRQRVRGRLFHLVNRALS